MSVKRIYIKANDTKRNERDVQLETDESSGKGKIRVKSLDPDEKDEAIELANLRKSEDGKKITGNISKPVQAKVTITIDGNAVPPKIKIVARKKMVVSEITIKETAYTLTGAEQYRLVDWIKNLSIGFDTPSAT